MTSSPLLDERSNLGFDPSDLARMGSPEPALPSASTLNSKTGAKRSGTVSAAKKRQKTQTPPKLLRATLPPGWSKRAHFHLILTNAYLFSQCIGAMSKVHQDLFIDFTPKGMTISRLTHDQIMYMSLTLNKSAFALYDLPTSNSFPMKANDELMKTIKGFTSNQTLNLQREMGSSSEQLRVITLEPWEKDDSHLIKTEMRVNAADAETSEMLDPDSFDASTSVTMPFGVFKRLVQMTEKTGANDFYISVDNKNLTTIVYSTEHSFEATSLQIPINASGIDAVIGEEIESVSYVHKYVKHTLEMANFAGDVTISFCGEHPQPLRVQYPLMKGDGVIGEVCALLAPKD